MPVEMRDAFGHALVALGHEFPNILVLDADLNTSSKTVYFKDAFPRRFIQCGIAEQNMFGIAAGLALQGYIPSRAPLPSLPPSARWTRSPSASPTRR